MTAHVFRGRWHKPMPVMIAILVGAMAVPAMAEDDSAAAPVQDWLDSWSSLQGRFQQAVASPTLPREQVETGRFQILRPDRMRWDYLEPEEKVALTDGVTTWLYLPEDRQVIRGRLESLRQDGALALLLSGGVRLAEAFIVLDAVATEGRLDLVLAPRHPSRAISRIDLVATDSGQILSFTVHDPAGNQVRWTFDRLERNPELSSELFDFVVPPGVEVQNLEEPAESTP